MKILFSLSAFILLLLKITFTSSQPIRFNRVLENKALNWGAISGMAQDKNGYIWIATQNKGLNRYDGLNVKTYRNDLHNRNSLAQNWAECLFIDSNNIIWVGTYGSGLDRFDPATETFTHYHHT